MSNLMTILLALNAVALVALCVQGFTLLRLARVVSAMRDEQMASSRRLEFVIRSPAIASFGFEVINRVNDLHDDRQIRHRKAAA